VAVNKEITALLLADSVIQQLVAVVVAHQVPLSLEMVKMVALEVVLVQILAALEHREQGFLVKEVAVALAHLTQKRKIKQLVAVVVGVMLVRMGLTQVVAEVVLAEAVWLTQLLVHQLLTLAVAAVLERLLLVQVARVVELLVILQITELQLAQPPILEVVAVEIKLTKLLGLVALA
jgi:hypothetical protein